MSICKPFILTTKLTHLVDICILHGAQFKLQLFNSILKFSVEKIVYYAIYDAMNVPISLYTSLPTINLQWLQYTHWKLKFEHQRLIIYWQICFSFQKFRWRCIESLFLYNTLGIVYLWFKSPRTFAFNNRSLLDIEKDFLKGVKSA